MTAGSTAILHSGHHVHKDELLAKIGGSTVLHQAVETFYDKLLHDARLAPFFEHANVAVLKWHQFNILSFAFTTVPEHFDIEDLILTRHRNLFEAGLCEIHFDVVMEHFVATLRELHVDETVIDQAQHGIAYLRNIFERGAIEAHQRQLQSIQYHHRINVALTISTITIAAAIVLGLSLRRSTKH